MALSWGRVARRRATAPAAAEPERSVAEVVRELQHLSGELQSRAGRLERVNERIEQHAKGDQ